MFINMILKTIPRSPRAAVALLVSLVALWRGTNGLIPLLGVSGRVSGFDTFITVACLAIGTVAGVVFYYFQAQDGERVAKPYDPLEVLNHAQETMAQHAHEEKLKHAATPVFSSHDGEVKSSETQSSGPDNPSSPPAAPTPRDTLPKI